MSRPRASFVLAWGLWSCWLVILVATIWFGGEYLYVLTLVGYATVGSLVASRQPGNAVGWLLLAAALLLTLAAGGADYAVTKANAGYVAVAWLASWLSHAALAIILVFLPLRFPTGRLPSLRWRPVWWFAWVTTVVWTLMNAVAPGPLDLKVEIENPLGVQGTAEGVWEVVYSFLPLAPVTCLLLASASVLVRFRRSRGAERQQLKWFIYAVLLPLPGLALSFLGPSLLVNDIGWTLFLVSCLFAIPTATGFAILRYRLYDIDVVINRTLVYGTLTATLLVFYAGSIVVLPAWLSSLTSGDDLAVVVSTLAVAALFRPARARIQAAVDWRFFRRKYDTEQILDQFSNRLSHEVDLAEVGSELCSVVNRSVQPSHISLWLPTEAPVDGTSPVTAGRPAPERLVGGR